MNNFNDIVGNTSIISALKKNIKENNTLHAYLICTDDVITRTEVGMAFAKAIMCTDYKDDACNECISCKTFDSMNNPDIKIIKRIKEDGKIKSNIMVDQIREVVNDSNVKPYSNKNKIYIIDDADLMNESAQNALLKTLEEPNEYTKLILLASNVASILPTILSRCITIKLMPLKKDEVRKWCEKNNIENENINYYINYAQGNITNLVNILNNEEFIVKREEILSMTEKLTSKDACDMLDVKEYLINEKDNANLIMDILEVWYRDLIFILSNIKNEIINFDKIEKLEKESRMISIEKANAVINSINDFRKLLTTNANYKIMVTVFQINIREV